MAKELILPRRQKSRGKFYLFAVYEVDSGRIRWAYVSGKSSEYVGRFIHKVRRWHPEQQWWIALDQQRSHPCKSRITLRVMRELKLHWISLPKSSPDDNPVETIFSDIEMMILDNSNDLDAGVTQKRISEHLRGRNRRKNRHIRIKYL